MTQDDFIKKACDVHGRYDYSRVLYKGYCDQVIIVCPEHSLEFHQTPASHLQGHTGCPKCKRNGYSIAALEWLRFMEARDKTRIQHVLCGGEKKVDGVGKVDGFSACLAKVYEFHGDYFHGNPTVYSMTYMNNVSKKLMGVLYLQTVDRQLRIKKAGFGYEEMWERNWKRIKRASRIIQYAWRRYQQGIGFEKRKRYYIK